MFKEFVDRAKPSFKSKSKKKKIVKVIISSDLRSHSIESRTEEEISIHTIARSLGNTNQIKNYEKLENLIKHKRRPTTYLNFLQEYYNYTNLEVWKQLYYILDNFDHILMGLKSKLNKGGLKLEDIVIFGFIDKCNNQKFLFCGDDFDEFWFNWEVARQKKEKGFELGECPICGEFRELFEKSPKELDFLTDNFEIKKDGSQKTCMYCKASLFNFEEHSKQIVMMSDGTEICAHLGSSVTDSEFRNTFKDSIYKNEAYTPSRDIVYFKRKRPKDRKGRGFIQQLTESSIKINEWYDIQDSLSLEVYRSPLDIFNFFEYKKCAYKLISDRFKKQLVEFFYQGCRNFSKEDYYKLSIKKLSGLEKFEEEDRERLSILEEITGFKEDVMSNEFKAGQALGYMVKAQVNGFKYKNKNYFKRFISSGLSSSKPSSELFKLYKECLNFYKSNLESSVNNSTIFTGMVDFIGVIESLGDKVMSSKGQSNFLKGYYSV
jgi:hypothetical protein